MKRRTLIRKAAVGGLVAAGAGTATAQSVSSPDVKLVMVENDGEWELLGTTDDVSVQDDCNDCEVECCGDCAGSCPDGCCMCHKLCEFP